MKKNETKIFDTAFQGIVAVITVRKRAIPITSPVSWQTSSAAC